MAALKKVYASEILTEILDFKRLKLRDLLDECNSAQVHLFNRMYGSLDTISEDKIPWAIEQVVRTVNENRKKLVGEE